MENNHHTTPTTMENNHHTTTRHHTTTNNRSMSDTDDEFHSPLHDIPTSPSKALVVSDNKYFTTTARSPTSNHQKPPQTVPLPPPVVVSAAYNRAAREEPVTGVTKMSPSGGEEGGRPVSPARRVKRDVVLDRAALGFRVLEVVLCLIAFSVMASDKTQGWSGDSFDRYKEYRYVVAVNAIAFAYAAFQTIDMTYRLIYKKHIISYSLRPLFDFSTDQILAYLLISASSSAATRVDDWVSNWGKDDFTEMATASIGMSFLAFLAFALSALISGYNLCNQKSL